MTSRLALVAILLLAPLAARGENWPGWRGPRGDGSSEEKGIATRWDGKSGEGILWKTSLPGYGHSSPVVWENRVFVTACNDKDESRSLICLDRDSGEVVWSKDVVKAPLEKKHSLNSYASGTPATDGKLIYVTFLQADFGSLKERTPGDLIVAAYDFAGNQKWSVKPGRFASVHGFCSSPILFEDKVIVNADHDGDSYIVALDRANGSTIWKVNRPNKTRSYVTPIIREIDGRTQMLFSGSKCVSSYDPHNGNLHWTMDGPTEQFVASLVYDGQLVYLTAGFPEYHILAVKPDGKGKVGQDQIVWRTTKGCSYVPSPIVVGKYFLVAADNGTGSCFEARTGERYWQERMGKHYSASLVAAGGQVYFLADDGITKVVRPGEGPQMEVVAENALGEYCYASPAISQGKLFIRGEKHLYCIGDKK